MTEEFARYVEENEYDDRAIREAAVAYVTARAGYIGETEMRASLERETADPRRLQEALAALEADTDVAQEAAYRLLGSAWAGDADAVRERLDQTKEHLELISGTILAITILFGLYLVRPPLQEEETEDTTVTERTPEGGEKVTQTRRRKRKFRAFGELLKGAFPWLNGRDGSGNATG